MNSYKWHIGWMPLLSMVEKIVAVCDCRRIFAFYDCNLDKLNNLCWVSIFLEGMKSWDWEGLVIWAPWSGCENTTSQTLLPSLSPTKSWKVTLPNQKTCAKQIWVNSRVIQKKSFSRTWDYPNKSQWNPKYQPPGAWLELAGMNDLVQTAKGAEPEAPRCDVTYNKAVEFCEKIWENNGKSSPKELI